MGRARGTLVIGSMLLSFFLVDCGDGEQTGDATGNTGASIAGPYGCSREGDPEAPVIAWELRENGTLHNPTPPDIIALGTTPEEKIVSGTWSATGNAGKVTSENVDYPFTIDGDLLVFRDGRFICRPAGPPPAGE